MGTVPEEIADRLYRLGTEIRDAHHEGEARHMALGRQVEDVCDEVRELVFRFERAG